MSEAQCLGRSLSASAPCSSQIVVMMFFASFAISSYTKWHKIAVRDQEQTKIVRNVF